MSARPLIGRLQDKIKEWKKKKKKGMKWFFLCRGQGALRAQFCRRGFPGIFFSRNSWLNTQVLRTLKNEIKESKASWKKKKTLKNVSLNISWKSFKASNHLNLMFFFFKFLFNWIFNKNILPSNSADWNRHCYFIILLLGGRTGNRP